MNQIEHTNQKNVATESLLSDTRSPEVGCYLEIARNNHQNVRLDHQRSADIWRQISTNIARTTSSATIYERMLEFINLIPKWGWISFAANVALVTILIWTFSSNESGINQIPISDSSVTELLNSPETTSQFTKSGNLLAFQESSLISSGNHFTSDALEINSIETLATDADLTGALDVQSLTHDVDDWNETLDEVVKESVQLHTKSNKRK